MISVSFLLTQFGKPRRIVGKDEQTSFFIEPLLLRVSLFYSCLHLGQEPVKVGRALELSVGNNGSDTLRVSNVLDEAGYILQIISLQ